MMQIFPNENIFVISIEQFHAGECRDKLCEFLGVRPTAHDGSVRHSRKVVPRYLHLLYFLQKVFPQGKLPFRLVQRFVRIFLSNPTPALQKQLEVDITQYYASSIVSLNRVVREELKQADFHQVSKCK